MKRFLVTNIKSISFVVIILALAWVVWYAATGAAPSPGLYTVKAGNVAAALDEAGTVVAENNADISFQESGRITRVYVREGQAVAIGASLAELNTASLEASLNQANAAVAAAQAKLSALETGATPQSIAVSQSALTSANQALANAYTGVPNILNDAYTKANDAVRTQLVNFFSSPESGNPQLTFTVSDPQVLNDIDNTRLMASTELNNWQNEIGNLTASSGTAALDFALTNAANHLSVIHNLMSLAFTALNNQSGLSADTLASYKASVTTGWNEVNTVITEVSNAEQAVATDKAAVAQAQANLNFTTASSTLQSVQEQEAAVAQAEASSAAAQIALNEASLTAPFPGTVQNLTAQVGEVVSPGTVIMSLVNSNGLKIEAYVSELDVAKVKVGDTANITLDAFGLDKVFPATVTAVDSAETLINGVPSYLLTLHFTELEPQIKVGMTGNVHLVIAEDDNVTAVPSRLILNDGNQNFVLLRTATGIKYEPVALGLVGDNGSTEITAGVKPGDVLVNF